MSFDLVKIIGNSAVIMGKFLTIIGNSAVIIGGALFLIPYVQFIKRNRNDNRILPEFISVSSINLNNLRNASGYELRSF